MGGMKPGGTNMRPACDRPSCARRRDDDLRVINHMQDTITRLTRERDELKARIESGMAAHAEDRAARDWLARERDKAVDERDEARAEVERLRKLLGPHGHWCFAQTDSIETVVKLAQAGERALVVAHMRRAATQASSPAEVSTLLHEAAAIEAWEHNE